MTNQQPLKLQLSNGEEVSIQADKSILQFTENNQQHNCAIVRGKEGTVVSNANGDVQINGVPSSTHLLQEGDQLQFGSNMTASVQKLGQIEQAINSMINQQDQPSDKATSTSVPVTEEATFSPATAATEFTPATQATATPTTPDVASPNSPAMEADAPAQPEVSSFAADLLARIKADENEPVGTQTSETTHSPLATDGSSFSSPTVDSPVSTSAVTPELETEPAVETTAAEPSQVETTTAESSERQAQSNSVSALLERMKAEGQWDGVPEEAEFETETQGIQETPASPEPTPAPVVDETPDDVQSYMSQLLSRMRDPSDAAKQSSTEAATPVQQPQATEATAVNTKPAKTKLLKPEEYVPKTKAKRLDSLQDMRALANTQTRTAIDRSQAKREAAFSDHFYLAIAVTSVVVAVLAFTLNLFGDMTFAVAMIAMLTGAFFCCKTYFTDLIGSKQDKQPVETTQEPHEALAE